ncbi:MAG: beta-galactosidase [Bacteroidales bacterium]
MTELKSTARDLLLVTLILFSFFNANAQNVLSIDASNVAKETKPGNYKMGNPGQPGREILINNQFMTIGGKPVIPVMGEMHFSRVPKEQWEDVILKMKASGINIIAFYAIWIHHEEIEGQFDWSGNKDIRSFIKLCQYHGMLVYPRIGPWAHGEVRNGGTPDWILKKKFLVDRSNDPVYQSYVDEYFKQLAGQMHDLMYKDGGPIIGVQLENEYSRGKDHILWLKNTARKYGIDVPLYTVTGWDNASVPENEVIPLWGAYPGAPWNSDIEKITKNPSFEFDTDRKYGDMYPFFTCELGVGNQITEHRRPVFSRFDGSAIATIKIGSGSNLTGYYVFAGGSNPVGILTGMEENREETGYWNTYPKISYDFQAAIKETGELAPSYYQVKKLHYFLNQFGEMLAPMVPVVAKIKDPANDLQFSVRVKDNSGFLFGINYYRGTRKPVQKNVQFKIKLIGETLQFPSSPVDIPDSSTFIWPFNFRMNDVVLKYATAQPLCRIGQKDRTDWFFIQNFGIQPEFCLEAGSVRSIESTSGKIIKTNNQYIITGFIPGIRSYVKIVNSDGKEQRIVVLSFEESDKVWLFNSNGRMQLFISNANIYQNQNQLHLYGPENVMKVIVLSDNCQLKMSESDSTTVGDYRQYEYTVISKSFIPEITPLNFLSGSERLNASVKQVDAFNQLYNKIFIKEFNLDNPSAIRSAKLILSPDISCKVEINKLWLNQEIMPGKLNQLDITGYLQKGNNQIMIDFPFTGGEKSFAAKIKVEYMNSDEVTIVSDLSWLTTEQYIIPSYLTELKGLVNSEILTDKTGNDKDVSQQSGEYLLKIPDSYMKGLSQLYLHVNYNGDRGELRFGYKLISDNFNNFTPWQIALKQFGNHIEGQQLKLKLFPFEPDFKIYFDRQLSKDEKEKTYIRNIEFVPEYSLDLLLGN